MTEHIQHAESTATGQRSLANDDAEYPLWPPLTEGCPETSTDQMRYPLDVTYDYEKVPGRAFDRPLSAGLERWASLLPPLAAGTSLGEGNTPLNRAPELAEWLDLDREVYVKDESQNPTWSQKDRLNRCAISAALAVDATGVVVSSSGNHGASAAAYAARANLPCVVLTSPETPAAVQRFLRAYDAAVVAVERWDARQRAVNTLAEQHDYHAVSSRTEIHTGHPFGPEGYKTIAYEIYLQLDRRVPGTVFVPTSFAELLFGVWKGFRELSQLGLVEKTPRMVPCEPRARGPLAEALETDVEIATVDPNPTDAYSIRATTNGYRGIKAVTESDGFASTFTETQLTESQRRLRLMGHWQEASGAASVAGLRAAHEQGKDILGPIVCLATSSGFKDGERMNVPQAESEWDDIHRTLRAEYDLSL